jgi:hypothetical protein
MELIRREFGRDAVTDMSAEAWLVMNEATDKPAAWDQVRDVLIYEFEPAHWTWLVLRYPELACAALQ